MFYVIDDSGILQWEVNAKHAIPPEFGFTETPPAQGMIRPKFANGAWEDLGEEPYTPSHEDLCVSERLWRNAELARADIEINKLTDAGLEAQAWKAYRIALRNWPENTNFPCTDQRPVAPDKEA